MPQFDDNHVKLCGGFVVWDGVTRPETVTHGAKAGGMKWTLKVVFEPHNPDLALFEQLANRQLMMSPFKGVLPAGGRMPVGTAGPDEFGGNFNGWKVISFKTTLKAPDVYDENGAPIDSMALASLLYTGQKVDVLAHCYDYNSAGNKGVSAGLDAFAIIASANAPRLAIAGGINTASAFGGGAAPAQPVQAAAAPYQPAPPVAAPAPGVPAAMPAPAPAPVVKYRTPDGGEWTEAQLVGAGWPVEQVRALPQVGAAPAQPVQAHNFLPGAQ